MLKKLISKILPIILFVILALVIASSEKYVRRLLHIPTRFETVDSSDSELLNMLISKSRFSNTWQWDLIITNQFDHLDYDPNIKERAIRTFAGYYKGHDVHFIHTITKYISSPSENNIDPLWKSYGVDVLMDQISISPPQDSGFLPSTCYIGLDKPERRIIRCVLVREHGDIHERIDLDIYGEISTETVLQIVNNVVIVFDDKEVRIQ